jgi:SAM-dependent methyltransferase
MMNSIVVSPLLPAASYGGDDSFEARISMMMARESYVGTYGYVLLTEECRNALVALLKGKKVLDAGSGTGYLAHCLAEKGVDVVAIDNSPVGDGGGCSVFHTSWRRDIDGQVEDHLPGDFDAVILSWPNHDHPFGFEVVSKMRVGQMLVYQGEGAGGCTADDTFFEAINGSGWVMDEQATALLKAHHVTFFGVHDRWWVGVKTA